MLSRIADALFWQSRYLERTDALLRIMYTNYAFSLDKGEFSHRQWQHIAQMFSNANEQMIASLEQEPSALVQHLVYDVINTNAIRVMVTRARENARGAQDHITKEVWEQINHIYHLINNPLLQQRMARNETLQALQQLTTQLTLYNGVTDSTMPRNAGWNFMTLGKFIERAIITIDLSDRHFGEQGYELQESTDILYWRSLLFSLSGYELHLKTYRSTSYNANIADQIIFNKQFTRSVIYCLDRIGFYLLKVIATNETEEANKLKRSFGKLHSAVEYADLDTIRSIGLDRYLKQLKDDLLQFNNQLSQLFFSYS